MHTLAAAARKWAERYRVEGVTVVASIEYWDLGLGESQVIAYSVGGSRWAVLDDRAARRRAVAHSVPVIGMLGVVLRSKKNRQIESARSRTTPAAISSLTSDARQDTIHELIVGYFSDPDGYLWKGGLRAAIVFSLGKGAS